MKEDMYSVEQVAERLGLHVRTVRGYIRSGRLKAVRIGKQYRIAASDLDALTGRTRATTGTATGPAEVSSIVQIDGVDRAAADRLGTLVLASANTGHDPANPLRVQTVHDEERRRMKIIILGDPAATAELLHLLDAVLNADNGLFDREVNDA
ncbi:DNA binding domain-containing protein, excisionase family [Micromonospora coriariae]|uniref:DNA binding domain-containing protein, excisionase family n=1 Tax=Micromonospora coriariae TaxID=285665 RepID=A0A1C4V242_9ACTN|nr:helix-turn-helix domain-containing protein [Micromonospora coriariae]SCE78108.1 DNA binding domain-containing protein, excisionase family [Micromonospora coriariae]